jgi:hypothetical protein
MPQTTPTPALTQPPAGGAPAERTFENGSPEGTQTRLQPLQLSPPVYPSGQPRALDPETQDRVTSQPVRQALAVRPVSMATTSDNDGWRAARD